MKTPSVSPSYILTTSCAKFC